MSQCCAVSTGPTRPCWTIKPASCSLFLIVWSETLTPGSCWSSDSSHPAPHKRADSDPADWLRTFSDPVSWNPLHALETVLEDIQKLVAVARINMPSWRSLTTCTISVGSRYLRPAVTMTQGKCRTSEKSSEKTRREKCRYKPNLHRNRRRRLIQSHSHNNTIKSFFVFNVMLQAWKKLTFSLRR